MLQYDNDVAIIRKQVLEFNQKENKCLEMNAILSMLQNI